VVYTLQWLLLSWRWRTLHWARHYQVTSQESLFIKIQAYWIWARCSDVQLPTIVRDINIKTGFGAHTASYSVGTGGSYKGAKVARK
jgi:hypothetical protein